MARQKLEGILSHTLKMREDLWHLKLQVMPMSHKTTPADFLVLSEKFRYLIECKERKIKDGKSYFSFASLTQSADLQHFWSKYINNNSYILFHFREKLLKNSIFYLIDIQSWLEVVNKEKKKSLNLIDFKKYFSDKQIAYLGKNILSIGEII